MGAELNYINSVIDANVKQNGNNEITGEIMNVVLKEIAAATLRGYHFMGVLKADSQPPANSPWIYVANNVTYGAYQFGADELGVLYYDDVPMATPVKKILFSASNAVAEHNADPTAHQDIQDKIVQADWQENNTSALSHVVGRTHYKYYNNTTYALQYGITLNEVDGHANGTCYGVGLYPVSFPTLFVEGNVCDFQLDGNSFKGEIHVDSQYPNKRWCGNGALIDENQFPDTGEDWAFGTPSMGQAAMIFVGDVSLVGQYSSDKVSIVLGDAAYEKLSTNYIPDDVMRNTLTKEATQDDVTLDATRFYDFSGGTLAVTLPTLETDKVEIYRGMMTGSFNVTFPNGTYIVGDTQYLTIVGTTISSSGGESIQFEYNSATKALILTNYLSL